MSDEIAAKSEKPEDGEKVAKTEKTETEPTKEPKRTVSFNRDVHVKRFGKPRESRGTSVEQKPPIRKEPFTHLSEQQLIEEAKKVRAQAESVTCTADNPEKFFSLPHRKKLKEDKAERRNSDDAGSPDATGKGLGRSTSDVTNKKRKERTSLSSLFRKAQKSKGPDLPVAVTTKPVVVVKRSKSDVSDLKSNTTLNTHPKPIRKRSGSESEEFLKSLRNKKNQLSPIIESSPRADYFNKTSPLDLLVKQKLANNDSLKVEAKNIETSSKKVNPVVKPPRHKTDIIEPKPPVRSKKAKSSEKELSPSITETPKRKTDPKKTLLVDEIDSFKAKDTSPVDIKEKIKASIRKLEQNIYGDKEMIHSSQQPPDKPPLTRGNTVDHIVRILKEDQFSPPPKPHLLAPQNSTNINQPFSYTKPTVSPDPNLFVRTTSPERVPSPVNKMADKGIVYAHVVRDKRDKNTNNFSKQTIHKTYSPVIGKNGNISDEDEGLGYEERYKYSPKNVYEYDQKTKEEDKYNSIGAQTITDSPIKPRYREYRLTNFPTFEPTYANEYPSRDEKPMEYIDTVFRGRADGMDTKRTNEPEINTNEEFNELSHRRQLLESRLNARKQERERIIDTGEPISKYLAETDPIYEAEKRMKATEKYVNETARYYRHTVERDGLAESDITEEFNKYNSEKQNIKYNTTNRVFDKASRNDFDRRAFLNDLDKSRFAEEIKEFPPEPEYEPPSLELNAGKTVLSPAENKEKKYKIKKQFTSSQDALQSGHKYKGKDEWFGKRKGHYVSNPEITKEREDEYANVRNESKQTQSYHNSLRRVKNKDRFYDDEVGIRSHDPVNNRDYYSKDKSPRRYEIDSRLVDSGIENDFRKSSGEIHRSRLGRHESYDDVRNNTLFIDHEKRHTEDNYPTEQIYANGEYLARFEDVKHEKKAFASMRDHSSNERFHYDPKADRYDRSPSRIDEKIIAKPPKAAKKLSGLEKMKQLFSRDSSKKSKKEKEGQTGQPKARTRVLKSPEHLDGDDCEYKRYTDPEPSDIEVMRKDSKEEIGKIRSSKEDLDFRPTPREERIVRGSREGLDYKPSPVLPDRHVTRSREELNYIPSPVPPEKVFRGSREQLDYRPPSKDLDRQRSSGEKMDYRQSRDKSRDNEEKRYKETDFDERFYRTLKEDRRQNVGNREEKRRFYSSDRDSDLRPSDAEDWRHRARTSGPMDSPALAERYRERRRLATPSPTPSPPRRPTATAAGNWFKSLDRLTQKKKVKTQTKVEKELPQVKASKPLHSPAKNLRFFGDTDQESDSNMRHNTVVKSKSHPVTKTHSTLRKTVSNSSTGIDEVDMPKTYSISNLHKDESPRTKSYYKRNLHNISEIQSNSETESNLGRKSNLKPPMSPYERRSRSQSSSKTLKGSKGDLRRTGKDDRSSSADRRRYKYEDGGSELRSSRQELASKRRGVAAPHSGSSTEDSSHPSQRSVVYLHATTVGDIPDPGRISRNRSRDDVSSVNSSAIHVKSSTKSFSMFAPWSPRHTTPRRDLHYAQKLKTDGKTEPGMLQKNKSYSQTTLTRRPQNNRLTSSSTTLYRKQGKDGTLTKNTRENAKTRSNEVLNKEKVSRSISMPRDDGKKAGWFKLSNKNKKDVNTRVR